MTLDELNKTLEALGIAGKLPEFAVAIDEHTEDAQVYVVTTREIVAECREANRARLICAALNALPGLLQVAKTADEHVSPNRFGYFYLEEAVLEFRGKRP